MAKSPSQAETDGLQSLVLGREGRKWQYWHLQTLDLPPNSVRDFSSLEQVKVHSKPLWAKEQHQHHFLPPLPCQLRQTENISFHVLGTTQSLTPPPSPKLWAVSTPPTHQPPPVAVFWDQGILWGQERLHSWVKSLIEPEGTSQLWNARTTAARSPGVLEEFLDVLWKLHDDLPGVPGGRGHLVCVVQHERRHRDEQKGEGEHFHIPPPYHNHLCPSASATTAGQEQHRVQCKAKRKGCSRCLPVTTPGLGWTIDSTTSSHKGQAASSPNGLKKGQAGYFLSPSHSASNFLPPFCFLLLTSPDEGDWRQTLVFLRTEIKIQVLCVRASHTLKQANCRKNCILFLGI